MPLSAAASVSYLCAFLVLNLAVAVRLPNLATRMAPATTTSLHDTQLKLVAYPSAIVCGAVPVFDQISSRLEWPRDHATTGVAIVQRSA